MEEKCMGLKNEVALQEKQTGDVDRQLDETTRELHREREKLMAVIRMSGDLIFEYDIVNDKMYYAGPGEGILYSRQITEGYTDQLLKEAAGRSTAQWQAGYLYRTLQDRCAGEAPVGEGHRTDFL